ncbi:dTDP-4-dehydrorhamnose 3,5-epimerase family protein, partial [Aeromonas hydrophila]|uniref:dTDP-4-dehydrorhamnose 3,5-epimerase family protein n=1 Tax=Aeromonas hydrophila TaxID=644 RepID=UPI00207C9B0F
VTLSESADFLYKTTDYYHRESEGAICWNDPDISIEWPVEGVLLSEKDKTSQSFSAYKKG